jgi:hypothetical protein
MFCVRSLEKVTPSAAVGPTSTGRWGLEHSRSIQQTACSFGWWLMAGAGLF